jgi:predicted RNase H-like nuclease (RuvC/YqgF family)
MDNILLENEIKNILETLINEEASKVSRYEFGRVQFKIDELENSLNETIKELRKLQDAVPNGLKGITGNRITSLSNNLNNSKKVIIELKEKVKKYKKNIYSQPIEEKKK